MKPVSDGSGAAVPDVGPARRTSVPSWPACTLCSTHVAAWSVDVPRPEPGRQGVDEVLLALGNGFFATRGARCEDAADGTHYPGTYIAGVYDRVASPASGPRPGGETVVNLPNWLPISLGSPGGDMLRAPSAQIAHDHRALDLRRGVLRREVHTADARGYRSVVREERLVSMRHPHLAYLRIVVTPIGWSGMLEVETWTDDSVVNGNVPARSEVQTPHLRVDRHDTAPDGSCLVVVETVHTRERVALATRTSVTGGTTAEQTDAAGHAALRWKVPAAADQPVVIERRAALFTARDHAIGDPAVAAARELAFSPDITTALRLHAADWRHAWERVRLEIGVAQDAEPGRTQTEIQRALRVHLFHVVQTLSRHTSDADVGVPARGLHGEAYGGRVFWDELFVFPVLNLRTPELTRSLLMYRYRRLPEARRLAGSVGARGALFPWQSGSDGRDETPTALFNPRSGGWMPDNSSRQWHAGLAVAYNAWHYFQVTHDVNFLASYGAELLVEIARFWCDRAAFDSVTGQVPPARDDGP